LGTIVRYGSEGEVHKARNSLAGKEGGKVVGKRKRAASDDLQERGKKMRA